MQNEKIPQEENPDFPSVVEGAFSPASAPRASGADIPAGGDQGPLETNPFLHQRW